MPCEPMPYLLVSTNLATTPELRVCVCLNLIDHRAVGIALTKEGALEAMAENFDRLNAERGNPSASNKDIN